MDSNTLAIMYNYEDDALGCTVWGRSKYVAVLYVIWHVSSVFSMAFVMFCLVPQVKKFKLNWQQRIIGFAICVAIAGTFAVIVSQFVFIPGFAMINLILCFLE